MRQCYGWQGAPKHIEPGERAFHYGDGVFETVAIRNGEPRLWDYHLDRLRKGCATLGLEPRDDAALGKALEAALADSSEPAEACIAKLMLTAGSGERGYGRSMSTPAALFIGVYPAAPLEAAAYLEGVRTMLCKTRLATGSPVAGLKTINRIEQVLARSECLAEGVFEGLTQDAGDRLICGTMSNVFLVKDNVIRTPSVARCGVAGIMRRLVLEVAEGSALQAEIADIDTASLWEADEVFLTNSQIGAVPVTQCNAHDWAIGPVTRQVMGLLADHGIAECRP